MRGRAGLVAGALLLLAANALVLAHAARNRAGAPEAQLSLSELELAIDARGAADDTFRSLRLLVEPERTDDNEAEVPWLDRAKLGALGFDVRLDPADPRAAAVYDHTLPRQVLLVLELDGPAYRRAQARLEAERAGRLAAKPACASADCAEAMEEPETELETELYRQGRTATRLFAVDAGLDAAALRRRYPDRAHYAIAAGEVSMWPLSAERGRPVRLRGWVRGPRIGEIDVPLPLRRPFDALVAEQQRRLAGGTLHAPAPLRATVAWGRELEPWIVDLAPGPARPPEPAHAAASPP